MLLALWVRFKGEKNLNADTEELVQTPDCELGVFQMYAAVLPLRNSTGLGQHHLQTMPDPKSWRSPGLDG